MKLYGNGICTSDVGLYGCNIPCCIQALPGDLAKGAKQPMEDNCCMKVVLLKTGKEICYLSILKFAIADFFLDKGP